MAREETLFAKIIQTLRLWASIKNCARDCDDGEVSAAAIYFFGGIRMQYKMRFISGCGRNIVAVWSIFRFDV